MGDDADAPDWAVPDSPADDASSDSSHGDRWRRDSPSPSKQPPAKRPLAGPAKGRGKASVGKGKVARSSSGHEYASWRHSKGGLMALRAPGPGARCPQALLPVPRFPSLRQHLVQQPRVPIISVSSLKGAKGGMVCGGKGCGKMMAAGAFGTPRPMLPAGRYGPPAWPRGCGAGPVARPLKQAVTRHTRPLARPLRFTPTATNLPFGNKQPLVSAGVSLRPPGNLDTLRSSAVKTAIAQVSARGAPDKGSGKGLISTAPRLFGRSLVLPPRAANMRLTMGRGMLWRSAAKRISASRLAGNPARAHPAGLPSPSIANQAAMKGVKISPAGKGYAQISAVRKDPAKGSRALVPVRVKHQGIGLQKPGEAKRHPVGREFMVNLDVSVNGTLGMDVDPEDGKTLKITSVNAGAVEKWNSQNTVGRAVRKGDRILAVNGITRNAKEMVNECRATRNKITLIVRSEHVDQVHTLPRQEKVDEKKQSLGKKRGISQVLAIQAPTDIDDSRLPGAARMGKAALPKETRLAIEQKISSLRVQLQRRGDSREGRRQRSGQNSREQCIGEGSHERNVKRARCDVAAPKEKRDYVEDKRHADHSQREDRIVTIEYDKKSGSKQAQSPPRLTNSDPSRTSKSVESPFFYSLRAAKLSEQGKLDEDSTRTERSQQIELAATVHRPEKNEHGENFRRAAHEAFRALEVVERAEQSSKASWREHSQPIGSPQSSHRLENPLRTQHHDRSRRVEYSRSARSRSRTRRRKLTDTKVAERDAWSDTDQRRKEEEPLKRKPKLAARLTSRKEVLAKEEKQRTSGRGVESKKRMRGWSDSDGSFLSSASESSRPRLRSGRRANNQQAGRFKR